MSATKLEKIESPPTLVKHGNELFPVFLKLDTLQLLIIGGGAIALEKLHAVLNNAPNTIIKIVAIEIHPDIKDLVAANERILLLQEPYIPAHLEEAELVMVAVNDIPLAEQIRKDAKEKGLLINVADKPGLCDFYLGSVVTKGDLKIGISTNGKSPTSAKRIKEVLQQSLPDGLEEMIDNLHQVRNKMTGDFSQKVNKLNQLTRGLIENGEKNEKHKWRRIASLSLIAFGLMLIGHFIFSYLPLTVIGNGFVDLYYSLDSNFGWIVLAGFLAQLVDGALGMGYGVMSTTMLLSTGTNVAAISGSIHTAEIFASGASGYSHYKFGNVNKKLFKLLVIPGVIGAILGAILLTKLGESHTDYIRPIIASYTFILGLRILYNAFKPQIKQRKFKRYGPLAGAGGFFDSFGGGGWGPIVTSTLLAKGRSPRFVIGTVSITEFFVTLASAFTFFTLIGLSHWQVIVALIIGSVIAAPIAARLAGKLPRKTAFILVALLVIIWSVRIIVKSL